ncbi:MAG: DUF192 domain-containing protein [Patescibacteria group bacterium]
MKLKIVILVVAVVVLVLSFKFLPNNCNCGPKIEIKIGETSLSAEIVDTPEGRGRGLSGRKSFNNGEGMLFIFDTPAKYGFWMKDMNFDLDMVWIDDVKRVVGISKGVTKESYPHIFYPPSEIKYVLEIPSGFSDTAGLDVGQILSTGQ